MKARKYPFWFVILMVFIFAILIAFILTQQHTKTAETNMVQSLRSFLGVTQKNSGKVEDLAGKSVIIELPGLPKEAKQLELVLLVPKQGSGITPFLIGKYEVTQGQWQAVMDNNPSSFKNGPDYPVETVGWDDAKVFCAKINTMVKQLPGKLRFRLPTDKEWSWAVGLENESGNTPNEKSRKIADVFPWGTQWPPTKGAGNYAITVGYKDSYTNTAPVGSFNANKYGLYDMGGNVWEFCEDRFFGSYRKSGNVLKWCEHWLHPSIDKERTLRGASWYDISPDILLSSSRFGFTPGYQDGLRGFRVVLGVSLP